MIITCFQRCISFIQTFCGTPNYAAVELVSGHPYHGEASDIWAMGVILYILLTGKPPFEGNTITALYTNIRSLEYTAPSYFSEGTTFLMTDVQDLFEHIFVKSPEKRINMEGLRCHPWVTFAGTMAPPDQIPPILAGPADQPISSLIQSIYVDQDNQEKLMVYTLRSLISADRRRSISETISTKNNKNAIMHSARRKSITIIKSGEDATKPASAELLQVCLEEPDSGPSPRTSISRRVSSAFIRKVSKDSSLTTSHISGDGGSTATVITRRPSIQAAVAVKALTLESRVDSDKIALYKSMLIVSPTSTAFDSMVSEEERQRLVEEWHLIHRPPLEIRTLQFLHRKQCVSSLGDASSLFQDLHFALLELMPIYEKRLEFSREPDYYMFKCTYTDPESASLSCKFEAEICRLFFSGKLCLRLHRTQGNGIVFKDIYSQILQRIDWM